MILVTTAKDFRVTSQNFTAEGEGTCKQHSRFEMIVVGLCVFPSAPQYYHLATGASSIFILYVTKTMIR